MKVILQKDINAPAETVWNIVGRQFANVADWASSLDYSHPIDADDIPAGVQVAQTAPVAGRKTPNPLGELIEILIYYSDDERTFTFTAFGLPRAVSRMDNTTTVVELAPNRSRVTFAIDGELRGLFKLIGPLLQRRFATSKRGPAGVIEDLKRVAEGR